MTVLFHTLFLDNLLKVNFTSEISSNSGVLKDVGLISNGSAKHAGNPRNRAAVFRAFECRDNRPSWASVVFAALHSSAPITRYMAFLEKVDGFLGCRIAARPGRGMRREHAPNERVK
ncbi:hypothetical protein Y032_0183g922 [Ancylostoma ceylanicum]|uniref:Uncharacterized protein n=1 Tax=Ancylostoma ceylanicum TaxID=53326 RepID=A0A016SRJ7_9BILA|nr:hypothetical protein Y032_0183g922 [Ancylostoma ceylanicum]